MVAHNDNASTGSTSVLPSVPGLRAAASSVLPDSASPRRFLQRSLFPIADSTSFHSPAGGLASPTNLIRERSALRLPGALPAAVSPPPASVSSAASDSPTGGRRPAPPRLPLCASPMAYRLRLGDSFHGRLSPTWGAGGPAGRPSQGAASSACGAAGLPPLCVGDSAPTSASAAAADPGAASPHSAPLAPAVGFSLLKGATVPSALALLGKPTANMKAASGAAAATAAAVAAGPAGSGPAGSPSLPAGALPEAALEPQWSPHTPSLVTSSSATLWRAGDPLGSPILAGCLSRRQVPGNPLLLPVPAPMPAVGAGGTGRAIQKAAVGMRGVEEAGGGNASGSAAADAAAIGASGDGTAAAAAAAAASVGSAAGAASTAASADEISKAGAADAVSASKASAPSSPRPPSHAAATAAAAEVPALTPAAADAGAVRPTAESVSPPPPAPVPFQYHYDIVEVVHAADAAAAKANAAGENPAASAIIPPSSPPPAAPAPAAAGAAPSPAPLSPPAAPGPGLEGTTAARGSEKLPLSEVPVNSIPSASPTDPSLAAPASPLRHWAGSPPGAASATAGALSPAAAAAPVACNAANPATGSIRTATPARNADLAAPFSAASPCAGDSGAALKPAGLQGASIPELLLPEQSEADLQGASTGKGGKEANGAGQDGAGKGAWEAAAGEAAGAEGGGPEAATEGEQEEEEAFRSFLRAKVPFKAGQVIAKIEGAILDMPRRYTSVQCGPHTHFEFNSDLVFMNHSCRPTALVDVGCMEVRAAQDVPAGGELTFFYPSTEWDMQQPFQCWCGAEQCLGFVAGAKWLSPAQLQPFFLNRHIQQLMEDAAAAAAAAAADGAAAATPTATAAAAAAAPAVSAASEAAAAAGTPPPSPARNPSSLAARGGRAVSSRTDPEGAGCASLGESSSSADNQL